MSIDSSNPSHADVRPRPIPKVPAAQALIFALVAGAGCFLDLWTKRQVFAWRGMPGEQPIWWLWPHFVGIETSLNHGGLFGMGQNQVHLFAAFSVIALVGVIGWFAFGGAARDRAMTVVLACITAGILGNLYDRLGIWSIAAGHPDTIHAVRDWIRLSYYSYVWPNFNVADSLLVCSAAFLCCRTVSAPTPHPTTLPQTDHANH
jgi:signal peptidase II